MRLPLPVRVLHLAGVLASVALPAVAEDWQDLRGAEIAAALTARVLAYDTGHTQNFFADGRTLFEGDAAQWGKWRVEGDRYCSVWPPSDRWSCYGLQRGAGGLDLRFVSDSGDITQGRYVDLR